MIRKLEQTAAAATHSSNGQRFGEVALLGSHKSDSVMLTMAADCVTSTARPIVTSVVHIMAMMAAATIN